MARLTKVQRLEIVNTIISEIANRGRGFFKYKDKVASYFLMNGELFYEHAYVTTKSFSRVNKEGYFTAEYHGGTLRALIKEFSAFIRTGKDTDGSEGRAGLWSPHWGYTEEDMKAIRDLAIQIGYTKVPVKEQEVSNG